MSKILMFEILMFKRSFSLNNKKDSISSYINNIFLFKIKSHEMWFIKLILTINEKTSIFELIFKIDIEQR
jgi:hypothetical protein